MHFLLWPLLFKDEKTNFLKILVNTNEEPLAFLNSNKYGTIFKEFFF